MAKSAVWSMSTRVAMKLLGVISVAVLARLLTPADFGLVATASAFTGAVQAISEFSFELALIRDQKAGRVEYDTVWTMNIVRGAFLCAFLIFASGPMAEFFNDARFQPIVFALAFGSLIDGFSNVHVVDFRKHLDFRKDFYFLISGRIVAFVVTVCMAFAWVDYRALVAGTLAGTLARVIASYVMHPARSRPTLAAWRDITNFSKWFLINNVVSYVAQRSDAFVISKLRGPEALGVYSVASEIAGLVSTELVAPLNRVLNPGFSKLAQDLPALRAAFLKVLSVTALVTLPAAIGIGVVADPLVRIFLGSKWIEAIPLIQVLVVGHAIYLTFSTFFPVYVATAQQPVIVRSTVLYIVVMVSGMTVGVWYLGPIGAAYAFLGAVLIIFAANVYWMDRLLGLPLGVFIAYVWRPFTATALMAAAVLACNRLLSATEIATVPALMLAGLVIIGCVAYPIASLGLWILSGRPDGGEAVLLDLLHTQVWARLRRAK